MSAAETRERLQAVIRKDFEKGWKGVLPLLPYYADACEEAGHQWEAETARLPWDFRFTNSERWICTRGEFNPKRGDYNKTVLAFSLWGLPSNTIEIGYGSGQSNVELYSALPYWLPSEKYDMKLDEFLVWFFGEEKGREHFRLHTLGHGDPEGVR